MTKKVYLSIVSMLTTGMKVDPTTCNAYDLYDRILNMVQPLDNHAELFGLSDEGLKAFLLSYDYRSDTFEKDAEQFCMCVSSLLQNFVSSGKTLSDEHLVLITAILLYIKGTDVCQKLCNKLIKDIITDLSPSEDGENNHRNSDAAMSAANAMIELLSSNVVGQKLLDVETMFRMNDVFSSASNLLGAGCTGRSSVNKTAVPERHMRRLSEWGIDITLFAAMNQHVIDNSFLPPVQLTKMVDMLHIDTNCIDFENFTPSIYDIMNIKFCMYFHNVIHMALMTPNNDDTSKIVETVTKCLLHTDTEFKHIGYSYLTLVEVILNCFYALKSTGKSNGYGYYSVIRATQLREHLYGHHDVDECADVEKLGRTYSRVREIQQNVMAALKKLKLSQKREPSMESVFQVNTTPRNGGQRYPMPDGCVPFQWNPVLSEYMPIEIAKDFQHMLEGLIKSDYRE